MDVFAGFHGRVLAAVQQLKHDGVVPHEASIEGVTLEPPKDASHGDLATNAAMVLAKPSGLAPRALAERIVPLLASDPHIESVEIAGPGFINLTLAGNFWPSVLRMVLEQGDGYGRSAIGKGKVVNVEYVSANPTGPMHEGAWRVDGRARWRGHRRWLRRGAPLQRRLRRDARGRTRGTAARGRQRRTVCRRHRRACPAASL